MENESEKFYHEHVGNGAIERGKQAERLGRVNRKVEPADYGRHREDQRCTLPEKERMRSGTQVDSAC